MSTKEYFTVGTIEIPFAKAQEECIKLSKPFAPVTLAIIITKNEYELAKKACESGTTSINQAGCWIGLHKPANNIFKWITNHPIKNTFGFDNNGKPTNAFPWLTGEPNNVNGLENCVHMWRNQNYLYNDLSCLRSLIPLCQKIDLSLIPIPSQLKINEFRTIDGSNNNLINKNYGKTNTPAQKCVKPAYQDGYNSLSGQNRMNPREISNVIFKQFPENDKKFLDERSLTQFSWLWGQFIDHDITLMSEDSNDNDLSADIDIYLPCCDPFFDNTCKCDANSLIQVFRSKKIDGTGVPGKPRLQNNELTAWIDAGTVYGSDNDRAKSLRAFKDGRLRVSYGLSSLTQTNNELLPLNRDKLHNEPTDDDIYFIAGDVRVNEQISLTMIHTIFMRLHNNIAEHVLTSLQKQHPFQDNDIYTSKIDELTYQYTKLIVTAIIQKITYNDWLPSLFGIESINKYLDNYNGYKNNINPNICSIFSSSAFRFGHTQLTQKIPLRNNKCQQIYLKDNKFGGDIDLKNAFFLRDFVNTNTIDKMVNGFSCTLASKVDTKITDAVRDFLFKFVVDPNGNLLFGDRDLVSLNINRGRDFGLPDWNTVRAAYGLPKILKFEDISNDQTLNEKLRIIYDHDINNIDFYVGFLSEKHVIGSSFGETVTAIVLNEFKKIRDADRFWYENYIKEGSLLQYINGITFKDVLELTTNVKLNNLDINNNVFRNTKAISVFDTLFIKDDDINDSAKQNNNNILDKSINNDNNYIIKLNETQFEWIIIGLLIIFIICGVFGFIFCKVKNIKKKVKYTSVRMSSDASDVTDV